MSRGYDGIFGLQTLVVVVSVSVFLSAIAHTQAKPPVVFVATEDHKKEVTPLLEAIRGQLVDQPVSTELQWTNNLPTSLPKQMEIADELGRERRAIAVFWLTADQDGVIHLYLTVPNTGRVIYRRLSKDDGVLGEVLGMIVRTSVVSILAGGEGDVELAESSAVDLGTAGSGVEPGEPEEVETSVEKVESSLSISEQASTSQGVGPRLGIELGYRYEAYSKRHPALSGISVGLSIRLGRYWAITARTAFVLSELSVDSRDVALELKRHPTTLDFGFYKTVGEFTLGGSIGLGIDVVGENVSTADTLEPYGSRREVIFLGGVELRGEVRLWSEFYAWAAVGGQVPFNPVEYVAQTKDERITVARAFAVRPVALLGLTYRAF